MTYGATLLGLTGGIARIAEHPASGDVSGLYSRNGWAHKGHRGEAVGSGHGYSERSRPAVARYGAGEHCGLLGPDRISASRVFGVEQLRAGRHAGGLGCEQIPPDGSGTRIFVHVRWTVGYAPGSNQGHDGGRSGESQCRKTTSRLALPARRRKESAEDNWSTDPRSARSEHTASGGYRGTGCTEDGTYSSCDSYLHGTEDGGQPGNGRAGRAAGARAANGSPRRTHRHHFISLSGRSQSQEQFSRIGTDGQGRITDEEARCTE